ncbi:MAG: bile acid:sodium symporter family protein [Candidatus Omnitrophica bacterium]|nr:bile acid:sodium symporter family protein [Candidatus Omnitrophota bacterium]
MFDKFLSWFTRLMGAWVLCAVGAGYLWPQSLTVFKDHTEWLFAATMFGIGAVLTVKDFEPVFRKPHLVLLGTLAQFAIMPALGFFIGKFLRLPPELALGVILVGTVPGAMASNVISYLARADVAYSIALTSTSTFLSPVLTPALTYFFGRTLIEIPFWPMLLSIVKMVIVPLLLGMGARHVFKEKVEKIALIFPAFSTIFIAFICGLVVALNRDYLSRITLLIFAAVFLHNLLGLVLGYGAGKLYRFDQKRCRTLAFEVGMQNAGLGAVLSLKHFSPQAAIPNALFATWCIVTASLLAEAWSRRRK